LCEKEVGYSENIGLTLSHEQPVLVEAFVNGKLLNTSFLLPTKNGETPEVFLQPLPLKKGDWLEIKVYNKGQADDNFGFKITKKDGDE